MGRILARRQQVAVRKRNRRVRRSGGYGPADVWFVYFSFTVGMLVCMRGIRRQNMEQTHARGSRMGALRFWVVLTWVLLGSMWIIFDMILGAYKPAAAYSFTSSVFKGFLVGVLAASAWRWSDFLASRLRHPGLIMLLSLFLSLLTAVVVYFAAIFTMNLAMVQNMLL